MIEEGKTIHKKTPRGYRNKSGEERKEGNNQAAASGFEGHKHSRNDLKADLLYIRRGKSIK